jgi:hypothetical protein
MEPEYLGVVGRGKLVDVLHVFAVLEAGHVGHYVFELELALAGDLHEGVLVLATVINTLLQILIPIRREQLPIKVIRNPSSVLHLTNHVPYDSIGDGDGGDRAGCGHGSQD